MREAPDAIAHDQRGAGERVCLGGVLAEADLDPGQHVDGLGMLAVQLVEHRPAVDDDAVAALGIVDEHRQHLAARRMGVLGVVVVRRHLFGGEGDVVTGRIQLDVEDQTERRVTQRESERRARSSMTVPGSVGDPVTTSCAVAPDGFEEIAPGHLVGDALVMVEPFDLVAGIPQPGGPRAS